MHLENYGRVLRDCAKCLELNPRNVKALYRSARALLALDRVDEAHDCCEHALAVDADNAAVKAVREKCLKRKEQIEAKQRQKEERERREKEEKEKLERAFQVYSLTMYLAYPLLSTNDTSLRNAKLNSKLQTRTCARKPIFNLIPKPTHSHGRYSSYIPSTKKATISNHSMKQTPFWIIWK